VTSSLFLTALAPNLLAVEMVKKTANVELYWGQWFLAFAPVGVPLLLLVPLIAYWIYPPQVKRGESAPEWAAQELRKMGRLTTPEIILGVLVVLALVLWIFGGAYVNATTAALTVISLMVITRVVRWDDITANKAAWNTLAWFAPLVALADGLNETGFVKWFAGRVAEHGTGVSPTTAIIVLLLVFYLSHYLFASVTAHVTAMLPVMLSVGSTIPGMPLAKLSLLLCLTLGIMGIITPYGTGPSPVYAGSGYLPSADYWRLGAIFGVIYFAAFLLIGVPWLALIG
jgi:L-tartrate/succinate antiporter